MWLEKVGGKGLWGRFSKGWRDTQGHASFSIEKDLQVQAIVGSNQQQTGGKYYNVQVHTYINIYSLNNHTRKLIVFFVTCMCIYIYYIYIHIYNEM